MSTIVTRAGKGSPLTNTELDSNFTNLNTDKAELSGANFTGNLSLGDNVKAQFGASDDLEIYHTATGNHSIIEEVGGGSLVVRTNGPHIEFDKGSSEYMARMLVDGAVELYYDSALKLATTSTGIDVTGTVTADGLTTNGASEGDTYFTGGTANARLLNVFTSTHDSAAHAGHNFKIASGAGAFIFGNNTTANLLTVKSGGIDVTGEATFSGSVTAGSNGLFKNTANANGTTLTVADNANRAITITSPIIASAAAGRIATSGTVNSLEIGVRDYPTAMAISGSTGNINIGSSLMVGATTAPSFTTGSGIEIKKNGAATLRLHDEGSGGKVFEISSNDNEGYVLAGYGSGMPMILKTASTTALTLDTSQNATFSGSVSTGNMTLSGQEIDVSSGDLTLDVAGNINLDADGANVYFNDGGTERYRFKLDATPEINVTGGTFTFKNNTSDADILFSGNDGGSAITALTLDMSNAGAATFNSSVTTGSTVNAYGNGSVALQWGDTSALGALSFDTSANPVIRSASSKPLVFQTNGANERMRIDSSGNLLVGTTSITPQTGDHGFVARANGYTIVSVDNARPMLINRATSDGELIKFSKNSTTTVGSIGTAAGNLYIVSNDVGLNFAGGGDGIYPATANGAQRDAAIDLGHSTHRFKDLYLSNNATAQKLTLTKDPVGTYSIEVDGTNTGQPNLIVKQSTSERFRCDNNGNLLVGKTSSSGSVAGSVHKQSGQIETTVDNTYATYWNRITSDGVISYFSRDGVVKGSISISGSSTSYNTSSDERLKDNIIDAPIASEDIDAIQVRSFDWKADGEHQKYGMVAQELLEVAPDAVTQGDTPDDMMGVDYSKLVPMLIKEIQSLRQRVAQLEE